jgi:hypothetical protein
MDDDDGQRTPRDCIGSPQASQKGDKTFSSSPSTLPVIARALVYVDFFLGNWGIFKNFPKKTIGCKSKK